MQLIVIFFGAAGGGIGLILAIIGIGGAVILNQMRPVVDTALVLTIANYFGLFICPVVSLFLVIDQWRNEKGAPLLTALCLLMLQAVFLYYINYGDIFNYISENWRINSAVGYCAGWVPMLLYSLLLGIGVLAGGCDPISAEEAFKGTRRVYVIVMILMESILLVIDGSMYETVLDMVIWGVLNTVFLTLINFLLSRIASLPFKLFVRI